MATPASSSTDTGGASMMALFGAQQVAKQTSYAAPFGWRGLGSMAVSPFFGGALAQGLWGGQTDNLKRALSGYTGNMNTTRSVFNDQQSQLMQDFDTSMLGLSAKSKQIRSAASSAMSAGLQKSTDDFVSGLGPLNPQTEAAVRTHMQLPAARQIMEFNLGTFDQDSSLALSAVMGNLALEQQSEAVNMNLNTMQRKNTSFLNDLINQQPNGFERFLGAL